MNMKQLKNKVIHLLFVAVIVIFISSTHANAISLGTAPGAMYIGELERGRQYSVDFYLLTNSDKDLLVTLSYNEAKKSMFEKNQTGRYTFIPAEASEEDMSSWISFLRKTLVVSPNNVFPVRFPDGSMVNANERATIIINVPNDAEPGYHAFEVVLSPKFRNARKGTGVSTIGVTRPIFIFKVPGNAVRSGTIDGIAGAREGDKARIDVLFRNTGTVTVTARVTSLKIYNETGYYVETLKSGAVKVPPKSTSILKVYWIDKDKNRQKKIKVEATVDYLTGEVTKEAMVTIPKLTVTEKKVTTKYVFPWWILIIILGMIILYFYWRR
ncbi:MAG: hypothetical protein J7L45_01055 [Candidatus Aenigmarchaeota archaeon]|nr:hypothetical protein [Candidatus Aenigmarchaeota archaeon]